MNLKQHPPDVLPGFTIPQNGLAARTLVPYSAPNLRGRSEVARGKGKWGLKGKRGKRGKEERKEQHRDRRERGRYLPVTCNLEHLTTRNPLDPMQLDLYKR